MLAAAGATAFLYAKAANQRLVPFFVLAFVLFPLFCVAPRTVCDRMLVYLTSFLSTRGREGEPRRAARLRHSLRAAHTAVALRGSGPSVRDTHQGDFKQASEGPSYWAEE